MQCSEESEDMEDEQYFRARSEEESDDESRFTELEYIRVLEYSPQP